MYQNWSIDSSGMVVTLTGTHTCSFHLWFLITLVVGGVTGGRRSERKGEEAKGLKRWESFIKC